MIRVPQPESVTADLPKVEVPTVKPAEILQVISTTNQVLTKTITPLTGGTVSVAIAGSNGIPMPVSILIPANASANDLIFTVSSPTLTVQSATGFVSIKVTAKTSDNVAVTAFDVPININLGKLDSGALLAYSSDGFTWNTISQLSSNVLPANLGEGFYITPNGDSVILTRHLTSFGTKLAPMLIEITTKEETLDVGEDFMLDVSGIKSQGHVWFTSTTPDVCDVTSHGKVHPYAAGECLIVVSVAANGDHMDVHSEPTRFEIRPVVVAPVIPAPEITVAPVVSVPNIPVSKLLGSVYFTRSTWALDHNAYLALSKLLTSLKKFKSYSILLVGHSDVSKGLDNQALSLARSKTVATYLKKNSVVAKVAYNGMAFKQLVSTDRVNDALNRRVEMWVITNDK